MPADCQPFEWKNATHQRWARIFHGNFHRTESVRHQSVHTEQSIGHPLWSSLTTSSTWSCSAFVNSRTSTEIPTSNFTPRTDQRRLNANRFHIPAAEDVGPFFLVVHNIHNGSHNCIGRLHMTPPTKPFSFIRRWPDELCVCEYFLVNYLYNFGMKNRNKKNYKKYVEKNQIEIFGAQKKEN